MRSLWVKLWGGSSPPARGPRNCSEGGLHVPWAHPRLRGDHSRAVLFALMRAGSSPPARGPLKLSGVGVAAVGLIPACAGTTNINRA